MRGVSLYDSESDTYTEIYAEQIITMYIPATAAYRPPTAWKTFNVVWEHADCPAYESYRVVVENVLWVSVTFWLLCFCLVRDKHGSFHFAETMKLMMFTALPALDTFSDLAYVLLAPFGAGLYYPAVVLILPNGKLYRLACII
jgi:hypothetical protein